MTNGFRDSRGEHSHRKTRPVVSVGLITLTFLQLDFHTYPFIFGLLRARVLDAATCDEAAWEDDAPVCMADCVLEMSRELT